jgi:hypothetical protein
MTIEYLNHFHKYIRSTGVYRLLLLNNYGNYTIFRFKTFVNNYKIILLYLSTYTTHRLQSLNIQKIINKFNIQTFFLSIYKIIVKIFVNYIIAEILIRDFQMKKLQKIATNKKKSSKKIIELNIIYLKTWEIIQKE